MKPLPLVLTALLIGGQCRGGPTEQAILAAMRLSEQPNYGWTTTVADDARTYDLEGKTEVNGFTWMRLPMIKAISRRLGREADDEIEAFFRGAADGVIRTDKGWRFVRELPRPRWDADDDVELWPVPVGRAGAMATAARTGIDPWDPPPIVLLRVPRDDDDRRVYSNAQFAASRPHEELAIIVSSFTDLQVEGDRVTGVLSDVGARLLLVHDGQDRIAPLCAAGTFKLQIVGGCVVKYAVRLEGVLLVDRKKVHVHQSASTVVKNVGTTNLWVPDEVRRKFEP